MPIYEYRCEACGHQMEAMQKMSDPALTECPSCNAEALKKLMSAGSFRTKASGPVAGCGEAPASACGTGGCPARRG